MKVKKILSAFLIGAFMLQPVSFADAVENTPLVSEAETFTLTAAAEVNRSVTLSWENPNSDVTAYRILRAPFDAYQHIDLSAYEELAVLDGSATEYIDRDVERFDSFYYVVEATHNGEAVCSNTAFAYVEEKNPVFADIADLENCVQKIFTANEERIVSLAKQSINVTDLAGGSDQYATMYANCGPISNGLQKVLFDTGIICELRRTPYYDNSGMFGHIVLMIRANFAGDTSKVTNVIIDPTYRQFLRNDMRKACGASDQDGAEVNEAFENSAFPDVFVYEYGNSAERKEKMTRYRVESGFETAFSVEELYLHDTIGSFSYPLQEFIAAKNSILTNAEYDLIRNYGTLDKPYEHDIFIDGSWTEENIKLTYRKNGIYECFIPAADITENGSITVVDHNGTVIYGASSEYDELSFSKSFDYMMFTNKPVMYLNSTSSTALKLVHNSYAFGYYIRIDMRTGIEAPSIVMFDAMKSMYGDVNLDGAVDDNDVVLIQAYLAGEQQLDYNGKFTANVFEAEQITSDCVVDMQNYIAGLEPEGRTGQTMYLLNTLHILYMVAPVEDCNTEEPPIDDGTTQTPPVDDGNTEKPPIDDGTTENPPVDDGTQEEVPPTGDSIALFALMGISMLALAVVTMTKRRFC